MLLPSQIDTNGLFWSRLTQIPTPLQIPRNLAIEISEAGCNPSKTVTPRSVGTTTTQWLNRLLAGLTRTLAITGQSIKRRSRDDNRDKMQADAPDSSTTRANSRGLLPPH